MAQDVEERILKFMKDETLAGHMESTVPEIVKGTNLRYNKIIKAVERLATKKQVECRERGPRSRPTPYYYLSELKGLCQKAWG